MNYATKLLENELSGLRAEKKIIFNWFNKHKDREKLINELEQNIEKQESIIMALNILYDIEWGDE